MVLLGVIRPLQKRCYVMYLRTHNEAVSVVRSKVDVCAQKITCVQILTRLEPLNFDPHSL